MFNLNKKMFLLGLLVVGCNVLAKDGFYHRERGLGKELFDKIEKCLNLDSDGIYLDASKPPSEEESRKCIRSAINSFKDGKRGISIGDVLLRETYDGWWCRILGFDSILSTALAEGYTLTSKKYFGYKTNIFLEEVLAHLSPEDLQTVAARQSVWGMASYGSGNLRVEDFKLLLKAGFNPCGTSAYSKYDWECKFKETLEDAITDNGGNEKLLELVRSACKRIEERTAGK